MIISHSRKFIFVHVRKTAGESITEALTPYLASTDLTIGTTFRGKVAARIHPKRTPFNKHTQARFLRSHLPQDVWTPYFKFAFVRNPVDRTQSFYRYLGNLLKKRGDKTFRSMILALSGSASADPLRWPVTRAYLETSAFSEFIRHPAFNGKGQCESLCDAEGRIIVDFIGNYESLDADFARVTERIGLGPISLPRRNASRGSAPSDTLSPEDNAYLAEVFRRDFEIFGDEAARATCA